MPWIPNNWNVTVNQDDHLMAVLLNEDATPFNAAGASAVILRLQKQDSTVLEITADAGFASGIGPQIFIYRFPITAAQTQLLPLAQNQTVEIKVMFGSLQKFLILKNCMSVNSLTF